MIWNDGRVAVTTYVAITQPAPVGFSVAVATPELPGMVLARVESKAFWPDTDCGRRHGVRHKAREAQITHKFDRSVTHFRQPSARSRINHAAASALSWNTGGKNSVKLQFMNWDGIVHLRFKGGPDWPSLVKTGAWLRFTSYKSSQAYALQPRVCRGHRLAVSRRMVESASLANQVS